MGTVIQIWVQSPKATELLQEAERRLMDYEARFSANREDSELMQVNYEAGRKAISVDAELFSLIRLGKAQKFSARFEHRHWPIDSVVASGVSRCEKADDSGNSGRVAGD